MKQESEEDPLDSADAEGWRQIIAEDGLTSIRPETIVAGLQDLGPHAERAVLNPLAKHLSDLLIKMLRRYIGTNHPNRGEDMILRVHFQVFEALVDRNSADGRALRKAFGLTVKSRAKDAIATEYRHSRIPLTPKVREVGDDEDEDKVETDPGRAAEVGLLVQREDDAGAPGEADGLTGSACNSASDPALLDGVRTADEQIDVERVLRHIKDPRKRQVFRLYMDGVPSKSKRTDSIAKAVGVSSKTVDKWIEEAQRLLGATKEVQELQGHEVGVKP